MSSADLPSTSAIEGASATAARQDLARVTLVVLCTLLLIAGSLWILRPFLAATIWAAMLVVTTWPVMKSLEARFGDRRAPAVAVMTITLLLLLIVPLWVAIATLLSYASEATALTKTLAEGGLPQPPSWVAGLPLVGQRLSAEWARMAAAGPEGMAAALGPHVSDAARWLLARAGSLGGTVVQLLLVMLLAPIMYSNGEAAATAVRRFGRRLAGERGENAVILAGKAIRGVALGVGATAIIQTLLGSLGLVAAGIPFASILSALMLLLCIAQLGPALILFPAVGWLYWKGEPTWATILLVWSVVVTLLDNFLRPLLIKKGADLPLLLIFAGVIGGMLGFGLIGIFVGPVILAVGYTLLEAWIEDGLGKA